MQRGQRGAGLLPFLPACSAFPWAVRIQLAPRNISADSSLCSGLTESWRSVREMSPDGWIIVQERPPSEDVSPLPAHTCRSALQKPTVKERMHGVGWAQNLAYSFCCSAISYLLNFSRVLYSVLRKGRGKERRERGGSGREEEKKAGMCVRFFRPSPHLSVSEVAFQVFQNDPRRFHVYLNPWFQFSHEWVWMDEWVSWD